ncbi:alpha-endosulfine [Pseudorasbora parva]|uniref:alpha-endosulfine n=1 Tax=Pseudorasbora parva TaxID=51549 RepID=UPI00351E1B1A
MSESPQTDTLELESEEKQDSPEKVLSEEAKLKAKYPNLGQKAAGSAFLMKRLQAKGPKYFDSGDYNMAKAKMKSKHVLASEEKMGTGDHIPTPQDLPQRKPSVHASQLAR